MTGSVSLASMPYGSVVDREDVPHWLGVVAHLDPRYGGLSAVVPKLASAVAAIGNVRMSLAAFCAADESWPTHSLQGLDVTRWPLSRKAWMKDRDYSLHFEALAKTADGLHIHGLWEQSSQAGVRAARANKLPYVVSAHGMLEPWALNNKRLKKLIYSALIERSNVRGASCLHALTQAEADNYRNYCGGGTIAVIPNGVDIPSDLSPDLFFSRFPELEGKRLILFLGRLHFKKGIHILVKAWSTIARNHPDAHLVLAGPDSENTQESIAALVDERGVRGSVTFTGMLEGQLKWSALAAAECFVLPSYSEGLSVAALEAMGVGLPTILSDRCNLPDAAQNDAGWVIPADEANLRRSMEELLENSMASNKVMGQRAQEIVRGRFTWTRVAAQMSELYAWLAGDRLPASVELQISGGGR